MEEIKKIDIYTDGACSGNPGPGGWGAILMYNENVKEIGGSEKETTNNKMELMAVIKALESIKYKCEIDIYSDSAYVVNAFNKGWIESWQKNGWRNSSKEEVKNKEMWEELLKQVEKHKINFIKVKGHSDNQYNNRCDEIARKEIEKIKD